MSAGYAVCASGFWLSQGAEPIFAQLCAELEHLCLPGMPSTHKRKHSMLWHIAMSVLKQVFETELLPCGGKLHLHNFSQTLSPLSDTSTAVRHLNKTELATDPD